MPVTGLEDALAGLTIVSVEQAVAAPYCGLLLADAGARVIKVERKDGDFARHYDRVANGHSAYFVWLNRKKQSIALDFDDPDDFALLKRMIAGADVFLQNLAPGALERRGLTTDIMRSENPGLIACSISGYGTTGPYSGMKAYDLLVQAETGLCSVTGTADGPARVGISICDIATGLTAYAAILRALIVRQKTGTGEDIDIKMFDVLADWMNVPLLYFRYAGRAPKPMGVQHATLAPYGLYAAGDGQQILIAIQSNREWAIFCKELLEDPSLIEDDRFKDNEARCANRSEMDAYISRAFSRFCVEGLLSVLLKHRIACARLNSIAELESHPVLTETTITVGENELHLADLPVPGRRDRAARVPTLSEHEEIIRREFSEELGVAGKG